MTQIQKIEEQTPEWIARLSSDLRVQGYASVLNISFSEQEADRVIGQLLPEFKYLLYIEAEPRKKYFIADYAGRNTVIKLLERMVGHKKTARLQVEAQDRLAYANYTEDIDRLNQLQHMLTMERFG